MVIITLEILVGKFMGDYPRDKENKADPTKKIQRRVNKAILLSANNYLNNSKPCSTKHKCHC